MFVPIREKVRSAPQGHAQGRAVAGGGVRGGRGDGVRMMGTPEARHQDPGATPQGRWGPASHSLFIPREQALPAMACTDLAVSYSRGDWGCTPF